MTFEAELEKTINAQIEELRDMLEAGQLPEMHYHRVCGSLHTFRAVIAMIPETNKRIQER